MDEFTRILNLCFEAERDCDAPITVIYDPDGLVAAAREAFNARND